MVTWTREALDRFWSWELQFPEHYFANKYGSAILTELRPYLGKGQKVLDFGCGMGFLSALIAQDPRVQVWGVDRHPDAVRMTNERNGSYPNFRGGFRFEEILRLGVRFDRVVAVEVLEHLEDYQDEIFFQQVHAVLRPAGLLMVTVPNDENLARKYVLCPSCDRVFHRWQHVRSIDRRLLSTLGRQHGFRLVRTIETDFSRPASVAARLARIRSRASRRDYPHLVGIYVRCGAERGMSERRA
jgi:2-polyprenyl-3-methyl-5-hydroxy-6-metoxy-1,4-benzoquinol methylase